MQATETRMYESCRLQRLRLDVKCKNIWHSERPDIVALASARDVGHTRMMTVCVRKYVLSAFLVTRLSLAVNSLCGRWNAIQRQFLATDHAHSRTLRRLFYYGTLREWDTHTHRVHPCEQRKKRCGQNRPFDDISNARYVSTLESAR